MTTQNPANAEVLLSAVERITASSEDLMEVVAKAKADIRQYANEPDETYLARVADELISTYSTRSMVTGGAAALPALVPGFGTVLAAVGGTLADVALTLKWEVELALCLTALYGFDIRGSQERQLAFLLASVSTYDESKTHTVADDIVEVSATAIWNYTPRQVSKTLLSVMGKVALLYTSKGFLRLLPGVGIIVSAGVNKALTGRVGEKCRAELSRRASVPPRAEFVYSA